MKLLLNKVIIVIIFFFSFTVLLANSSAHSNQFIDTVNIRKAFFYKNIHWENLIGKKEYFSTNKKDVVGHYCDYINGMYVHSFFPSKYGQEDNVFSYGAMFFVFDTTKKLLGVKVFYHNNMSMTFPESISKAVFNDIISKLRYKKDKIFFMRMYKNQNRQYKLQRQNISPQSIFKLFAIFDVLGIKYNTGLSFLEFIENKSKRIAVFLFGKIFRKDLPFFTPIENLKYLSLHSVFSLLSQYHIDDEIFIDKEDYSLKSKFVNEIIKPSLGIEYVNDGAKNKFGEYCYIKTNTLQTGRSKGLNCSGFLKDVAENYIRIYKPDFKWLSIDELKVRRLNERNENSYNKYEEREDPYFGLDWVKNINDAINLNCNLTEIKARKLLPDKYATFFKFEGYSIDDLKSIIFRDQLKDSTSFYVVVFNKMRNEAPMIPTFYHIGLLVPYLKNHGFFIRAFDSNEEETFERMLRIHRKDKVAIFKIPIPYQFF